MTVNFKKISSIRIVSMICVAIFLSACGEDEALIQQNAELTAKVAELQSEYQKSQMLVVEYKDKAEKALKVEKTKESEIVKTSDREDELHALLRQKNRLIALKSQQVADKHKELVKAKAECKS